MGAQASTTEASGQGTAVALARGTVYHWLGMGWRYPDAALRVQLGGPALARELREACRVLDARETSQPLGQMASRVAHRLDQRGLETMEAEYIAAFGHIARGRLPLYETEYGDGQALRGVHELGDIAGFYGAFGLEVAHATGERVDHASVECAFLHVLCQKEAYAYQHHGPEQLAICRKAQERFLRDHLGVWMPSMARRLLETHPTTVYGVWAQLALAFLASERQRFELPDVSERLGLRRPEPSLEQGCQSCEAETAVPGGAASTSTTLPV
jgi:DMSO reductase family type II enzyme chaperone